jgi:hypothetical protein
LAEEYKDESGVEAICHNDVERKQLLIDINGTDDSHGGHL